MADELRDMPKGEVALYFSTCVIVKFMERSILIGNFFMAEYDSSMFLEL